ncbi:MAG: 6-carboxytetrahydropterin synthase [bacterium]|nr:6-carboxytetrahydropterin synthase [bacterium]
MYFIRVQDEFSAAHALTFPDGRRERLHGHNWRVEAVIACSHLDPTGLGVDFELVQQLLHQLLDSELDHRNLNNIAALNQPNPTTELVARWIADRLSAALATAAPSACLHSLTLWESPTCAVTYELPR